MKAQVLRPLLAAILGLVLAGCMSTGARKVDLKSAARSNAEAGTIYLRRGQLREAKDKLDEALKQDPNNFEGNWSMAALMEQLDRPAEADRYYQTALRAQPDNTEIANTYAAYLCKSGKVDEAVQVFDGLARNKLYRTPWAAAANAAVCLRADKRNADALKYIEQALLLKPDYVEAVIQKADLQLALGRGAGARQTVDGYIATPRSRDSDPRRPDLLLIGVRAANADGDVAAAQNYARLLRRDFPSSPQTAALPQLEQGAKK